MHRVLVAAAALTIGSILVGPLACRQIVGIESSPETDLTTTVCGLPYGTSACAACAQAHCCSESSACATSPACKAYEICAGACGADAHCRSQCRIDHPTGTEDEVSALSACVASNCADACSVSCGGVAELIAPPEHASECASCLATNPCDRTTACGKSKDCDAYVRCLLACPALDCQQACATTHPTGASIYAPFQQQDYSGTCSSACAYGSNWTCVGHFSWPTPKSPTTTLTIAVLDYLTQTPHADVDVTLCQANDDGCTQPVEMHSTDDAGVATFQPTNSSAFSPLGFSGYVQLSSAAIAPGIAYWGFPLSESAVRYTSVLHHTPAGTPAEVSSIYASLKVAMDPNRGLMGAYVYDCLGAPASNVTVTLSGGDLSTVQFYLAGNVPSITATATDVSGGLGWVNVPPGSLQATATPAGLGRPSSRETVYVRAGTTTAFVLTPTP